MLPNKRIICIGLSLLSVLNAEVIAYAFTGATRVVAELMFVML